MAAKVCILMLVAMVPESLSCLRGVAPCGNSEGPDFCHGLECPQYSVILEEDEFEERQYEASKWVSTEVLNLKYDKAVSTGFKRLFSYIRGENNRQEKVAMTAPVATRVIPGQGPACETNFTVYFYIPSEHASDAPIPTNSDVRFTDLPAMKVYVRYFGGYADQDDWLENARKLGEDLTKKGLAYVHDYYYTAGYDSPFRLFWRHNEVWFLADESQAGTLPDSQGESPDSNQIQESRTRT